MRVLFCRPALRREARAYRALRGTPGVPEFLGLEGADRLLLARVPGRPLSDWDPAEIPPQALDALEALLERVHTRGVAIADLHRSNVLVGEAGGVHVVDFALARIARNPERPGLLVRWLQALDRHACARIRAWALGQPEPVPQGFPGLCYRLGRALKRVIRQLKSDVTH